MYAENRSVRVRGAGEGVLRYNGDNYVIGIGDSSAFVRVIRRQLREPKRLRMVRRKSQSGIRARTTGPVAKNCVSFERVFLDSERN